MNASLLQRLSVITDEEKQLQQNPKNLNYTACGSVKRLQKAAALLSTTLTVSDVIEAVKNACRQNVGKPVHAGPTKATALGNLIVQMITAGVFTNLTDARTCIRNSFPIETY